LIVNRPVVVLFYDVKGYGSSGVKSVQLYLTQDNGQSWQPYGQEQDVGPAQPDEPGDGGTLQRSLTMTLPDREGVYGLHLVARSGAGLAKPAPGAGTTPQMRVELDTTPPEAELMTPLADPASPQDRVLFTWRVAERNLSPKPITLEWAERKEGPWHIIGEPSLPNTGKYSWKLDPKLPAMVYLRLTARDLAGNVAVAVTETPVALDLCVPEATLRDARPANLSRPDDPDTPKAEPKADDADQPQARLGVSVSGPSATYIGRPATWTIRVSNSGKKALYRIGLFDRVPDELNFTSATDGGKLAHGVVAWDLGTLQPGETRVVHLSTKSVKTSPRVVHTVVAAGPGALEANDRVELEIRAAPAYRLEVVDLDDPVEVGEMTSYKIDVTNQASLPGRQVQITCTLPEQTECVNAEGPTKPKVDGRTVTFPAVETLQSAETATYTVKVKAIKVGDARFKVELRATHLSGPVTKEESTTIYRGPRPFSY
jgi:hypothetical protein